MTRHREGRSASCERHDDERIGAGTALMALALFAGVVAGATIAGSLYREEKARRRNERRDRIIERWEGEGGSLPGTVGTGGAANPRPAL